MINPEFPTKKQIKSVIKHIEKILKSKDINKRKNFFAKEAYILCLQILNDRYIKPHNDYFIADKEGEVEIMCQIYKKQIEPVKKLKTVEARSITILCIDWLNGVKEAIKFLNTLKK